jgi:hypothetical protein
MQDHSHALTRLGANPSKEQTRPPAVALPARRREVGSRSTRRDNFAARLLVSRALLDSAARRTATLAALTIALTVAAVAASHAEAHGLKLGFWDGETFQSDDPGIRATWFNRAVGARTQVVRLSVLWRKVVGDRPPAHPADPGDPDYDFSSLDAAVEDASARHLQVMLTVAHAPAWAEGKDRPPGGAVPPGAWKPNASAFGQFARALGKRYSGQYRGLPRVRYFEVWNEPNLTKFLAPQWQGKKATSPKLYRRLLNRFYAGVKTVQPGAKVIGGVMSPFGDYRKHPLDPSRPRLRPLVFLRKLLCLKQDLKPAKCSDKPHFNILSQHPLNFTKPPSYQPFNPNDVQVANFHKVGRILRAAERAHRVRPRVHHQLWATEYSWYTNPPNPSGVSPAKQAKWIEEGFYRLWKQGASVVINYPLRDLPRDPTQPISRWATSGVFFHDASRKPSYRSFRFPFVAHRRSKSKVGIWGKAPESGDLEIQKHVEGGWHTMSNRQVRRGQLFMPTIRLRGHAELRGKIGDTTSLPWHQR